MVASITLSGATKKLFHFNSHPLGSAFTFDRNSSFANLDFQEAEMSFYSLQFLLKNHYPLLQTRKHLNVENNLWKKSKYGAFI
jgi:hypothetical protein